MGTFRTKEDDVAKISTTVYVTNFPESLSAKELFNSCEVYGYVVDSFIPTKRSKNVNGDAKKAPAIVLDDECLMTRDLSKSLLGRVKVFASLANLKLALCNKGFVDIKIQYMGEFWVMMKFANIESIKKFRENVSVGTWFSIIKDASLDFYVEKRIAWDEIEGIPFKLWSDKSFTRIASKWGDLLDADDQEDTCFHSKRLYDEDQEDTNSNDDGFNDQIPDGLGGNSDGEEVNENILNEIEKEDEQLKEGEVKEKEEKSEDPFNIYTILNKKTKKGGLDNKSESCLNNEDGEETDKSKKSEIPRTEGSILGILEEVVKVGQIMGYNMEGCMSNMTEIIEAKGMEEESVTKSYSFVMIRGVWRLTGQKFMIIAVYAPHDTREKQMLWDYLQGEIRRWKGESFSKTVEDAWKEYSGKESNAMRYLMGKLKHLKSKIRDWNNSNRFSATLSKKQCISELEVIDKLIDNGNGDDEVMNKRVEMINKLQEIDKLRALEVAQKAKIKWAVEGDENSRFFHGMLNKKRNIQNVRGVMADGVWVDNPTMVKKEFFEHFRTGFCHPGHMGATIQMEFPKKLSDDELRDIECDVTNDEIKRAVWDCGTDKAPGSDGFTFGFFRRFWDLIQEDVYAAVRYFFVYSDIPKGCNSAFISLIPKIQNANLVKDFRPISLIGSLYKIIAKILANRLVGMLSGIVNEVQSAFVADRQILDGPFILNEVIQWCKSKKKQALIFKVDFEKAYDSVRGSILVNGSPTEEFQFGKGLKQGDPLSPFLFILIMESLHISFQRIVDADLFKGIKIGGGLVNLSHLFYADDAVVVGQWCDSNITTLVHVLECFHKASGLRINMCKSKIMGVNVEGDMVNRAAGKLGCLVLKTPFSYLGSTVGGNMSRKAMWNDILERVKKRLSKWKMQMLSIGGRLTLVKSVLGSMPIFYFSIFKVPLGVLPELENIRKHFFNGQECNSKKATLVNWKRALSAKERGGLGSLFAMNRALLFKWVWRFFSQDYTLWARVIKAIHGSDGRIGTVSSSVASKCSMPNLSSSFRRNPRGGCELEQFLKVEDLIDENMMPTFNCKTRWVKYVPIKVNIRAWKVTTDSLPTRYNISRHGICIDSILCAICNTGVETSRQLFFSCDMARDVVNLIIRWWNVPYVVFESYKEWLAWFVNIRLPSKNKKMLEGVFYVTWWLLWWFRNKTIFEGKTIKKAMLFDEVPQKYQCSTDDTMSNKVANFELDEKKRLEATIQMQNYYRAEGNVEGRKVAA
uniref:RNA-directed DNA polymerase, eukaryota n=1 Tax=Tanacetum cinerariifolium TaxID=118510 RepID=A0A699HR95_TANCI|nr:RNA-directed DNA polymerase, eukaryota [Tanacetum cinerariifolium]